MAAVLPLKVTSAGKKARMVGGTDYLDANVGGTGQTAWTAGDLLYATGATTLAKLGIGTALQVLRTNAGATAPEWAAAANPATEVFTATADAALIAGQAVYMSASGAHVNKAKGDAASTAYMVGLAAAAISNGATGSIQTCGIVTLTTGQWDALAGTTGGLTFNAVYWLSAATAGLLTGTAPNTTGNELVAVGVAISTTQLKLYDNFEPVTV